MTAIVVVRIFYAYDCVYDSIMNMITVTIMAMILNMAQLLIMMLTMVTTTMRLVIMMYNDGGVWLCMAMYDCGRWRLCVCDGNDSDD